MRRQPTALAVLLAAGLAPVARGHEILPGYLELDETSTGTYSIFWKHPSSGERRLRVAPVFPPDCSFTNRGRQQLTAGAAIVRGSLGCPRGLGGRTLAFAGLAGTLTDVLIRVRHKDGRIESHLVRSVDPSVTLGATSAGERAVSYLQLGVQHILLGADHLLFVLGLLLIVRGRWPLLKTITSFTVAHSVTLALATLGHASAPRPPLNAAIALSILCLGCEVVRASRGRTSLTIRHPWVVAFAFGLLHGFGFASGLGTLGLPQAEIPLALLVFNSGVELGQLVVVCLFLGLARSFVILEIRWPRLVERLPGYAVGSLGAYWTIQRTVMLLSGARG